MSVVSRLTGCQSTPLPRLLGLCFLVLAGLTAEASAQTMPIVPIDDFNGHLGTPGIPDGWTAIDTSVGQSYGPGMFDASSGAFHIESGGLVPSRQHGAMLLLSDQLSTDPIFSNGYLRARMRAETEGTLAQLAVRGSPAGAYQFNGSAFNGQFGFTKLVNGRVVQERQLPGNLFFDVNEWWNIEAGAVGDQLSMKVWRDGEHEPESPQWRFTDSTLSTGDWGLLATVATSPLRGPARVSATFDDVSFRFPPHDNPLTLPPYDIYLWESPMPIPQVEGPFFVADSPEKSDMRGDVITSEDWPDLRIAGQVTNVDGEPIPGLKLDFWQPDDQGSYDNSGGYDLRGHIFTDEEGNYELWTVMPANYESIRTRHLHAKIGGENRGFDSWAYTTQFYFPEPYDNDIDSDGTPDKVIEGGVQTELDAIALSDDSITAADLASVGAEFSDLVSNIVTVNNNPLIDGYFDTTLDIVMPSIFQGPLSGDYNGDRQLDTSDLDLQAAGIQINDSAFDLDGDGDADSDDRFIWVREFKGTWIGDANLDGEFSSEDMVAVFQAGKYELDDEAGWAEGDWNGDLRFGSEDMVAAFQDGGYELGTRNAVNAVPEPTSILIMLMVALFGISVHRRRTRG